MPPRCLGTALLVKKLHLCVPSTSRVGWGGEPQNTSPQLWLPVRTTCALLNIPMSRTQLRPLSSAALGGIWVVGFEKSPTDLTLQGSHRGGHRNSLETCPWGGALLWAPHWGAASGGPGSPVCFRLSSIWAGQLPCLPPALLCPWQLSAGSPPHLWASGLLPCPDPGLGGPLSPASRHGPRISSWKLNSYSMGLDTSVSSRVARHSLFQESRARVPKQCLSLLGRWQRGGGGGGSQGRGRQTEEDGESQVALAFPETQLKEG